MKPEKYVKKLDRYPWISRALEFMAFGEIRPHVTTDVASDEQYREIKEFVRTRVKHIAIRQYSNLSLDTIGSSHAIAKFGDIGCLYQTAHYLFYKIKGIPWIQVIELEELTCREALDMVRSDPAFENAAFLRTKGAIRIPLKEGNPTFPQTLEFFLVPT